MSTVKHSPWPWILIKTNDELVIRDEGLNLLFCDTPYFPVVSDNAMDWHLIAAAPELLAALEAFSAAAENLDPQSGIPVGYQQLLDALTLANAAIAKASGAAK